MGLISSGIDKVRVFELPVGVRMDGGIVAGPRVCLVKWRSEFTDKIHQVYVNGKFAGATVDAEQRQMVVQVVSCFDRAARIEVFAVEPSGADIDFSDQLDRGEGGSGRVKLSLLRSQRLAVDARYKVYYDKGTGEIDYEGAISEGLVWGCWQDKGGFGLAKFGEDDFGYGWSAGVGFGRGSFALGEFGVDADIIKWESSTLEAGVYRFAVKTVDSMGNESIASETGEVTVIPAAKPVIGLSILSFDEETKVLKLETSDRQ